MSANPWLADPEAPGEPGPPSPAGSWPLAKPSGPTIPQPATVPAPPPAARLPVRTSSLPADLWWLGVHGGAGETTLAELTPGWPAAGHAWPAAGGGGPVLVVLVARTHQRGLVAARAAATEWASGLVPHVSVLGLVLVADAPGRLPRSLRENAQLVGGAVARVWSLPWVEPWRLGNPVTSSNTPRAARRLLADLRQLIPAPGAAGTNHRKERH